MEESLTLVGDYDAIVYNAKIGLEDKLADTEFADEIGLYYELGSVSNVEETESFKAIALKDELSEDIYHMTFIRGNYPERENEIAVDVSVVNTYGIVPYPGETVLLKKFDLQGEYIEDKEYTISGVFKASDSEVVGGWYRCPEFAYETASYQMPAVYFYPSDLDTWRCSRETVFFRSYSEGAASLHAKVSQFLDEARFPYTAFEVSRRNFGQYWNVGLGYPSKDPSREEINKAVSDGLFKRDFYSAIVFPVISLLIIITEVVSLYMLSKNIIADRKEHYAILRSIGMSSRKIVRDLVIEIFGFGIGSAVIGTGLGYAVHILVIRALNEVMHLRLYDGINADQIIQRITYNPVVMSLSVCICSLALSLIIPLNRLYRMYPAELLSSSDSTFVGKKKRNRHKTADLRFGWLGVMNRRIDLHEGSTMLVMTIVLSASLFGYVFFRSFAAQATGEARGFMNSLGIDGTGYVAAKDPYILDLGYCIFNRHDAGVEPSFTELMNGNPDVEETRAVIFNESTRMVFDEEPEEDIKLLLGNRLMNYRQSDNPIRVDAIKAEEKIFEYLGYDPHARMYELPTVGLTANEMKVLEEDVISGQVDLDKIRSGEEVVLAVPEELKDLCMQHYPVGSSIIFDDILLSDEEEKLDFHNLDDPKWIIYENDVEIESGVTHTKYAAVGKKYGVGAKVGAIVVLHNEQDINDYLTIGTDWVRLLHAFAADEKEDAEPSLGMSVLCLADSFESWGLPDKNYTSVKVKLKEGCNIYQFDESWYKSLAGSVDVKTRSTFEYMDEISIGTNRVMTIFCILIISLVLLGIVAIITGLYTKTRTNLGRFQTLRRIGLSVNQVSLMIYTQNMFYPLVASLIAIIPVCVMQKILDIAEARLERGEFDVSDTPWYHKIPYTADLFSYDFIPALMCCLLLGLLLVVIGTLPQIIYLRKMKMIETREE
ncbi:MAG: ABC transporter permease [Saccharofermentans sp.]|nr:ABC transporter permease [Saccharofermentans sp.]